MLGHDEILTDLRRLKSYQLYILTTMLCNYNSIKSGISEKESTRKPKYNTFKGSSS
jgi:hypothetical protein